MKTETKFKITLIADERFLKSCVNVETLLSVYRSSLKTAICDEGIEIYSLGEERLLDNWQGTEKEVQLRQDITLILSKPLSKNKIYEIINQVQAQPINFRA
jgi:hypothetical protein